jgi:hypothetical protein
MQASFALATSHSPRQPSLQGTTRAAFFVLALIATADLATRLAFSESAIQARVAQAKPLDESSAGGPTSGIVLSAVLVAAGRADNASP